MPSITKILAGGAGLLLGVAVSTSFVAAQDGFNPGEPNSKIPCPHPSSVTLILEKPDPLAADFPGQTPSPLAGLHDTASNRQFRHTFAWSQSEKFCCEITSATLKIELIANSEAGNDSIGIYSQGANVAGVGGYIYSTAGSGSAPAGTQRVLVLTMNAAALANMNTYHRLSFGVQDDTRVEQADLTINACCVIHYK